MSNRRWMLVLFASCWVGACAESTGLRIPAPSPQTARWLGEPHAFEYSVSYRPGGHPASGLPVAKITGPTPEVREASFWAYQEREQSVLVRYQGPDSSWRPYVELVVPPGALSQRPDGSLFAPGDSVLITLTLDSATLRVHLEPTGLVFSFLTPARLTMWYTGADPDFDGNGIVDGVDEYIEQTLLGLWVRVNPADPLEAVVATHSLLEKFFAASLLHFSGYEVAW